MAPRKFPPNKFEHRIKYYTEQAIIRDREVYEAIGYVPGLPETPSQPQPVKNVRRSNTTPRAECPSTVQRRAKPQTNSMSAINKLSREMGRRANSSPRPRSVNQYHPYHSNHGSPLINNMSASNQSLNFMPNFMVPRYHASNYHLAAPTFQNNMFPSLPMRHHSEQNFTNFNTQYPQSTVFLTPSQSSGSTSTSRFSSTSQLSQAYDYQHQQDQLYQMSMNSSPMGSPYDMPVQSPYQQFSSYSMSDSPQMFSPQYSVDSSPMQFSNQQSPMSSVGQQRQYSIDSNVSAPPIILINGSLEEADLMIGDALSFIRENDKDFEFCN